MFPVPMPAYRRAPPDNGKIVDLDSTNGTFVNGNRLSPNVPAVFSIGDIVRIANLDFKVNRFGWNRDILIVGCNH